LIFSYLIDKQMNPSGQQCPFCNSTALKKFSAHASDTAVPCSVQMVECTSCISAWQWPFHRSEKESISVFDDAYETGAEDSYFDPIKREAIATIQCDFIINQYPRTGKLLDIGCGDGSFARIMANNNWQVTGLDPALPHSVNQQPSACNIQFVRGTIDDISDNELYDVITLWDVVEHLENPQNLIAEAASRLIPGGLLVIETGNYQSAGRITAGYNWWNYQLDHRWYLAPPQLQNLMKESGLCDFRLADRVMRPWWKGRVDIPMPRLVTLIKSIVKRPFCFIDELQRYHKLWVGHTEWKEWGGLEIMTMVGRRPLT